ncbi:MAG TPA: glutaredoxin family protein, partial [Thermodesulfobacteriota bacterium]|nr:glutaredoxin family protein [Thermodesulfobacteriota bacterium]
MMNHISGRRLGDVVLYALSTCPWCQKVKKLLHELDVDFHFIDVDLVQGDDLRQAMEAVEKWNPRRSFPVLVINNSETVIGFDEGR